METRAQLLHQEIHRMGYGSTCGSCRYEVIKREIQDLLRVLYAPGIEDDEASALRERIGVLGELAVEVA